MTALDVYCSALDRQVIVNRKWHNGNRRYIKIGRKVYVDDYTLPVEVNMLNEKGDDEWVLSVQVTRWFKFKFRIRLVLRLWSVTA